MQSTYLIEADSLNQLVAKIEALKLMVDNDPLRVEAYFPQPWRHAGKHQTIVSLSSVS